MARTVRPSSSPLQDQCATSASTVSRPRPPSASSSRSQGSADSRNPGSFGPPSSATHRVTPATKILDVFEVSGEKWQEIITIARDAAERGWWDTYGDAMGARQRMYTDIESGAATIRGYNQMSIPGLLQAPEFMQALIDLDVVEDRELNYVPESSLEARMRRQQAASRVDGPSTEYVVDEFVLRRLAIPAPAMAAQLRHMVEVVSREPRSAVHVLPLDARLPPGRLPASTYTIYTLPAPADPPVVVAESTSKLMVHTEPHEVAM